MKGKIMNKIILIIAGFLIISCGSFNEANGQAELHLHKNISTGQELIDLQEAFDKGIINETEFETIKNRIVEGNEVFVIDTSEVDAGGIELHATTLDIKEDDWEPTEVSAEDISSANDLLEMHLRTTLEELTPEAPTVLDVDSRDQHLTHQLGTVSGQDIERTADVLAGIDASIDEALAERERLMVRDDLRLRHLEFKMEELLERTAHADANELIDIVDELRVIEHELGLVSEDAMEAFEMEDEEIRIAHLSTIRPTTRLLGEEE